MITNRLLHRLTALAALLLLALPTLAEQQTNPAAIAALLNRIGGEGTAERFVVVVDDALASNGRETFVVTSADGRPCIKGSSIVAATTGINWYLNHVAHINLAWNQLTADIASAPLPVPTGEETHTCSADYRYYLNYCTFSYSASTWTWDRWQKEIDWMALHGINMPLQIVGLDVVWNNLLTKDLGYTQDEANEFIAGPCFQAWWGMNNLQGWGGKNPAWWYTRQETLAKNILQRERELGMEPVLPGYAGMVPSDIAEKGYTANNQGNWNYFVRPYILDPNSAAFTEIAEKYYARLAEVMGTSTFYSMDPFHEGANTSGIDVASAYKKIGEAMTTANAEGRWVIQFWQWSSEQYNVLSQVEKGRLIVLDLFSDAHTHFSEYQGHDAVYCILPNFGGRTGLFGRLTKVMTDFYAQQSSYSNIKGVGATPEAIEQVPVLYDALFELPWRATAPDPKAWLEEYATARYGTQSADAQEAWELIRNSALCCQTSLQGPHEAVFCARPSLSVQSVSSWGGTSIFYDPQDVVRAAHLLSGANLEGENYSYDLTDFTRQALTDYGYYLLEAINAASTDADQTAYQTRRDAYLSLMLDIDSLLCTNSNFMLGRWTQMARSIADEAEGTTEADRQWLELDNARTLITTWGPESTSEWGGLRDYSYREWGGMMKDFYLPRWKAFFANRDNGAALPSSWFSNDWAWAHNASLSYSNVPTGQTADVASALLKKYFLAVGAADSADLYLYRFMETDATKTLSYAAFRGEQFAMPIPLPDGTTATLGIDFNNDGLIAADETSAAASIAVPSTSTTGKVKARLQLSDGTNLLFTVALKDNVVEARTVSVATANAAQGTASITGTTEESVSTTADVEVTAKAKSGYNFLHWTDADGNVVSTDNPYTYYGAAPIALTAHFFKNKWGSPTEDLADYSDMSSYGQYIKSLGVVQNGGDERTVYSTSACPEKLFQTTSTVNAPQGSQIQIHWTDAGGLNYCRLSAYADLNADGDFTDSGETLAVVGEKESAANTMLNDYTLTLLLPYDVPLGLTHVRLRFDSSWATGWNVKTGAMPAKSATKRMVYDLPLNITDKASTPCTVTVLSANAAQGTADANGQPSTYTYRAGEEIVLRAYPATGYSVKGWTDQYGREVPTSWVDGNFLRFYAPESGTYTVNFTSGEADGISSPALNATDAAATPAYDLAGRRLPAQPARQHGIVVRKGEKSWEK